MFGVAKYSNDWKMSALERTWAMNQFALLFADRHDVIAITNLLHTQNIGYGQSESSLIPAIR